MSLKKTIKAWIVTIFIFISFVGAVYYTKEVILWKIHTNQNSKIKKESSSNVNIIKDGKKTKYKINFNNLKQTSEDIKAYIKLNNTSIDYLVVQGENNDYYLNHNLDKKWNIAGWIFIDFRNKLDGSDKNIIIYGHNMKDGSMFGTLKNALIESWYKAEENQTLIFITEKEKYEGKIFSSYTTDPKTDYLKTEFNSDQEYKEFLDNLRSKSVYKYETDVTPKDEILTLSTCNSTGKKRVVLHARITPMK